MSSDTSIHPYEEKILLALQKLSSATAQELAKETGIIEASIHKATHWAHLKGYLSFNQEEKQLLTLTKEGESLLTDDFPEITLLKTIKTRKKFSDIKNHKNLNIALAWAKKNKWVTLKDGTVSLTKEGKEALKTSYPLQNTLKKQDPKDPLSKVLVSRKLATMKTKKTKTFTLTDKGASFLKTSRADGKTESRLTSEHLRSGSWKKMSYRPYSVSTPTPQAKSGKMHPYMAYIAHIRERLMALGFEETKGSYVETEFWNSDALFMPHDHPARGIHDIFMIKSPYKATVKNKAAFKRVQQTHKDGWVTGSSGWGHWDPQIPLATILRSQTTAVSARTVAQKPGEGKFFTIDRVFRPDVLDATHSFEFYQCDCIVIGEHLTVKHLLGYLEVFAKEIAGAQKIRFRPSYFPFTEPSIEVDAKINGKWIEVAGSGIFRPEVTSPLGIDKPVLAWAFGIDRLAMIKLGVTDIRDLYSRDVQWLSKQPIVR